MNRMDLSEFDPDDILARRKMMQRLDELGVPAGSKRDQLIEWMFGLYQRVKDAEQRTGDLEAYERMMEQERGSNQYIIKLNKYQRDNLLMLLHAMGWHIQHRKADPIEPFTLANTGDWVAEIGWMLSNTDNSGAYDDSALQMPNLELGELRKKVNEWSLHLASEVELLRKQVKEAHDYISTISRASSSKMVFINTKPENPFRKLMD